MGIYHKVGIRATEKEVISALTTKSGLANWWTREVGGNFTSGVSEVGELISFGFGHGNVIEMKVQELTSNQVLWKCISGPEDWIESHIDFQLKLGNTSSGEKLTIIIFRHKDWKLETEFTAHCSMKWATFLLSLKNYIEIGVGKPSPDDIKIDDIN